MTYGKIKDNSIEIYPYSYSNLYSDNPYTSFDNRYDLSEWYAQTEDAIQKGYSLVEVHELAVPDYNTTTHRIEAKSTPELIDGRWIIDWDIVAYDQPTANTDSIES